MRSVTAEKIIDRLDKMFAAHGYPVSLKSDNGPQFTSEVFQQYLATNGIVHNHNTALWPQANGEIERQNETMLKSIRAFHAGGQDWRKELNKFLIAYRTTPHTVTGVSPSEMMFGRKVRSKLPQLNVHDKYDPERVRERDAHLKWQGKRYADQKRGAKESEIKEGDQVLLRQDHRDKLSAPHENEPYTVLQKTGSQVTVESQSGATYERNSSFVKKFHEPAQENSAVSQSEPEPTNSHTGETGVPRSDPVEKPRSPIKLRPQASIKPSEKYKDFVTYVTE